MYFPVRFKSRPAQHQDIQDSESTKDQSFLKLSGYDILKPLGEGSYGKVRVVRQKKDGSFYAMKYVDKRHGE